MRWLLAPAALLAAVPALAAPGAAGYAETAARIANAIAAGKDLSGLEGIPSFSRAELAELRNLAGCKASVASGANKWRVTFNWVCSAPLDGVDARQTQIGFTEEGAVRAITINPVEARFAPTEVGLAAEKLESSSKLAKRFASEVRKGGDPSVGGLVPLTPLQREQLAVLAGRPFRLIGGSSKQRTYISWDGKKGVGDLTADIYFDAKKRPIGVMIVKAVIIAVIETVEIQ